MKYFLLLFSLTGCATTGSSQGSMADWGRLMQGFADTVAVPNVPYTGAAPMRPIQQTQQFCSNPFDCVNPQGRGL